MEKTLIWEGKLTCNVEINKPEASTLTYLPASVEVRKGVMTCNVNFSANVRKVYKLSPSNKLMFRAFFQEKYLYTIVDFIGVSF